MQSPTVCGAQSYRELCLAAKKEEKRLAELRKMQQYLKDFNPRTESLAKGYKPGTQAGTKSKGGWNNIKSIGYQKNLRCYLCDSPGQTTWTDIAKIVKISQGKKTTQKNSKGVDVICTKPNCSYKGRESQYA